MNVVKCKNGHFFDGDAYTQCPHCGEFVGAGSSTPVSTQGKSERKKFGWGKKDDKPAGSDARPTEGIWNGGRTPTDVLDQSAGGVQEQQGGPVKKDKTLDFWQTSSSQSGGGVAVEVSDGKVVPADEKKKSAVVIDEADDDDDDSVVITDTVDVVDSAIDDSQGESLRAAVKKASANSAGKTMSYFSAATGGNETANAPQVSSDPVVGWLVCIGGKHFGQSFIIGAGKNSIGRNDDNRIVLSMDNSVSRSKHALITYEPKKRNFYLQPGDSSGLTYLNDDYIDESKKLKAKDIIELGESKFIFIPLCDETFTWEDYMRKE